MGGRFSGALWTCVSKKKDVRILFVGLDAAGKTTILYKLKLGEVVTTIPTIGFNVEQIEHQGVNICCWDVGGKDKVRPLWRHYFPGTDVLVYIVDSNDRDRAEEAGQELARFMNEDELRDAKLLVWVNKQDLPNAMPVSEIIDIFRLHSLRNRQWHAQAACAHTGYGLYEGIDWIVNVMNGTASPQDLPPSPSDLIVSLHVDEVLEGSIESLEVTCASLPGEELASITVANPRQFSIEDFRAELADRLAREVHTLILLTPSGQALGAADNAKSVYEALCSDVDVDRRIRCSLERCAIS